MMICFRSRITDSLRLMMIQTGKAKEVEKKLP